MADLMLLLILGLFAFVGYKKGFAKMMISALANIISIACGIIFTGPLAAVIYNSPIGSIVSGGAQSAIDGSGKLEGVAGYVAADAVAMVASSVISFILITLVVRVIIGIVAQAVNLVAKFPLIKQANRSLGAVIGAISGFVICYAVLGMVYALYCADAIEYNYMIGSISDSFICSLLCDGNIVAESLSAIL